jgi:hypothetical protein
LKSGSVLEDLQSISANLKTGLTIKIPLKLLQFKKKEIMPWYNGDYPPSYKNQPKKIRDKATEIANEVLKTTGNEGEAIATGLKQARAHFANLQKKKSNDE